MILRHIERGFTCDNAINIENKRGSRARNLARSNKSPKRQVVIGVICGMLTMIVMIAMRDLLRNFALAPYFSPSQLPVAPQWSILEVFALLFLAGFGTLFYMLRKFAIGTEKMRAQA